tara:strand:+ start:411 stop:602 length:192 start_codon:yes stop_codon:yes gene_type:complete
MIQWFLNLIGWGEVNEISWFGNVNEENSWGIVYPFNSDGSFLRVDTIMESSDVTYITTDQTKY